MKKFTKKYKRKHAKIHLEKNHEKWIKRRVMKSYKKILDNPNSGMPANEVFGKIFQETKNRSNLKKFSKKFVKNWRICEEINNFSKNLHIFKNNFPHFPNKKSPKIGDFLKNFNNFGFSSRQIFF